LADAALAGLRFFHLGAHRPQIIRRRNYRKEKNQRASKRENTLQSREPPAVRHTAGYAPQPEGRHRKQQPAKIKQELHFARATSDGFGASRNWQSLIVFQKCRISVNVTSVLFVWKDASLMCWIIPITGNGDSLAVW
jgi:hypothetical protein